MVDVGHSFGEASDVPQNKGFEPKGELGSKVFCRLKMFGAGERSEFLVR
jgi:hypothetical protein